MKEEEKQYQLERLADYKVDMEDDNKNWQQAEQEVKDAIIWREKMALNYASSAVRYFNFKNELEEKLNVKN
jgi:hypothetical protein